MRSTEIVLQTQHKTFFPGSGKILITCIILTGKIKGLLAFKTPILEGENILTIVFDLDFHSLGIKTTYTYCVQLQRSNAKKQPEANTDLRDIKYKNYI